MLPNSRSDREYQKFVESSRGGSAVKIAETEPSDYIKPVSLQSHIVTRLLVSDSPVAANSSYTSPVFSIVEYEKIVVRLYQAGSSSTTIYVEESEDGASNWFAIKSASIGDGSVWYSDLLYPTAHFIRIRVINTDSNNQTALRLRLSLIP